MCVSLEPELVRKIDARRRAESRSGYIERTLRMAIPNSKSKVPEILRGGARIEHLVTTSPAHNRLYLNSSSVYPEQGAPFGVPHDAVGRTDEFVQKGRHAFDENCEACRLLADFLLEG